MRRVGVRIHNDHEVTDAILQSGCVGHLLVIFAGENNKPNILAFLHQPFDGGNSIIRRTIIDDHDFKVLIRFSYKARNLADKGINNIDSVVNNSGY